MSSHFRVITQFVAFIILIIAIMFAFYQRIQSDPAVLLPDSFESFFDVPTIDLSPFYEATNPKSAKLKQSVANEIAAASSTFGSFYISIPQQYDVKYRNNVLSNAYELFSVDDTIKQSHSTNSNRSRGYILYGTESGSRHYFEHKEGFSMGFNGWNDTYLPNNDMEEMNIFPPQIDSGNDIERSFDNLFDILVEISYVLLRAYSIALYQDESVLVDQFKGGETISILRLFHYFSTKTVRDKDTSHYLGSSPHSDWGLLTVIIADDVPGLQLYRDGEWQTVTPRFNESLLFVNCGDFMSILSDGQFISPLHRVLSPMGMDGKNERMSFVFFFYPEYEAKIPLRAIKREYSLLRDQSDVDSESKSQFDRDLSFGAYIKEKWKQVTVG